MKSKPQSKHYKFHHQYEYPKITVRISTPNMSYHSEQSKDKFKKLRPKNLNV